jgi:hypothetical protein
MFLQRVPKIINIGAFSSCMMSGKVFRIGPNLKSERTKSIIYVFKYFVDQCRIE